VFLSLWVLRIALCVFVSMGSEDCFVCFCLYEFTEDCFVFLVIHMYQMLLIQYEAVQDIYSHNTLLLSFH